MHRNKAFTLVELIVVITILAILGTIGYISLIGYNLIARDTVRVSDITNIAKVIELSKLETGIYPAVTGVVDISFSGSTIWEQGSFGKESHVDARRISEVPTDPLTGSEYAYSTTLRTGEYQVGAILERDNTSYTPHIISENYAADILPNFVTTLVRGNYNGKFITHTESVSPTLKNIYVLGVPSILSSDILNTTLQQVHINNTFVYKGSTNAPATYSGSINPGESWISGITNISGDIAIIYQGTNQELSTGVGKIDMIENIQSYYVTSNLDKTGDLQDLIDIDTGTNSNEAITLVNTYLNTGIGGFVSDVIDVETSKIVASIGGGGGGLICTDMTDPQLAVLNSWGDTFLAVEPTDVTAYINDGPPGPVSYTKSEWCDVTVIDSFGVDEAGIDIIDEIGLLTNLEGLSVTDSGITVLPQSLADLNNVTSINLFGSPALAPLDDFFDENSSKTCGIGIGGDVGDDVCFEGNGTTIDITIE